MSGIPTSTCWNSIEKELIRVFSFFSYSFEERENVANILKMIRFLHSIGNHSCCNKFSNYSNIRIFLTNISIHIHICATWKIQIFFEYSNTSL